MPTLQFKGKTFVQNHHLAVPYHQLVPVKKASITKKASLHDNLIVHGDNLLALKALLPTYGGKVKCIYIDPPYNTGNEGWAYNDNVASPMIQEWLKQTFGGHTVDKEDLTRHDKWLCMMMPRLRLLRELLSEDGVIFISCDDNEQHNLRCLLDEVFGEGNFIQNIIWQKKYSPQNDAKYFSDMHDFIICYAKNKIEGEQKVGWSRNLLVRTEEMNARYANPDDDERGDWKPSDFSVKTYSPEYDYPIKLPSGRIVNPPQGRGWSTSKTNFEELIKDDRIWFGATGDNVPSVKRFLTEVKQGSVPVSIWNYNEVGHNQEAKQELKEIFDEIQLPFDTPKPVRLLRRIIEISTNPGDIVLDSFAGSGTTAQAVLAINQETESGRRFILIEGEDYADKITAERVRRVIKGVPTAKSEMLKAGLSGTFSYFRLGDAIEMESLLQKEVLPTYTEFARYLFYTATGEEWDESAMDELTSFIGKSRHYEIYLFYQPDHDWLRRTALTIDMIRALPPFHGKQRLVFAPAKYVDDYTCLHSRVDFCQLPYEIYRLHSA